MNLTNCLFHEFLFHAETLTTIEFKNKLKFILLKKCRKVCVLILKQYICKVNKAQN